ncbi:MULTISPECIES: hypothetical protein [Allobacillus]|uniref:Lipoprotein n=1 Tax=Allobacillus halotolerans TaxID=570278 RepID=A0ABS6GPK5_9BACI|nr:MULTISPECIES: hypothetical protein [Allobacillus]MBU6080585.1 hypothetical protein [Allobacillus halotolerans]TSJ69426.1 hypothetical protein FPQ10_02990 [Allobacillus sp. SKP2-8]
MNLKLSLLIPLIVFLLTGCAPKNEPTKEFTFKNESENWEATISGTYSRGNSDIFEETTGIFTYKGEKDIRSIDILTYTSGTEFMRGTEANELSTEQSIETSFDNFGFWEDYEEGKKIILEFEWREGDRNTKRKEKMALELME